MRDALSIFDRVVSFSGNKLTRQSVTENLNVLDYETFFTSTDLILENKIPELLIQFNTILSKGFDGHHYIAGLASHFRDLMVCKNPATIPLLEVGEDTSLKYMEQSQKTTHSFLMEGIRLANDCDLKYKTSKNQRLLVELTLMQLASITFDGEKKNLKHFIIPPSYFRARGITPIPVTKPKTDVKTPENRTVTNQKTAQKEPVSVVEKAISIPKISINKPKKSTSGLSLKSIREKKEHQLRQMEVVIDEDNLPKEPVTQEALNEAWKLYTDQMDQKGEKIMASILQMDQPKLKGTTIHLTYSNNTNKIELERAEFPLMAFLKKKLLNYDLKLHITVNEEIAKKYAFTPLEKYEKLKEKNPNLEVLRQTFGLDI